MRMSFITNQIIKRNKKWKVYTYIWLINCEYFNNLNEDRDMAGIFISPSPYLYPIEKIGDFPYPYPYSVNARIPYQNGDGFGQYPRE